MSRRFFFVCFCSAKFLLVFASRRCQRRLNQRMFDFCYGQSESGKIESPDIRARSDYVCRSRWLISEDSFKDCADISGFSFADFCVESNIFRLTAERTCACQRFSLKRTVAGRPTHQTQSKKKKN